MPVFSYTCLPSGLDHLIVNVKIYTHCSIGLFPKSGTNELNQGRKDQKWPKRSDRNDPAETTESETTLIPDFV